MEGARNGIPRPGEGYASLDTCTGIPCGGPGRAGRTSCSLGSAAAAPTGTSCSPCAAAATFNPPAATTPTSPISSTAAAASPSAAAAAAARASCGLQAPAATKPATSLHRFGDGVW